MSSQYIFDNDNIKFRKKRTSVWAVLRKILVFFVATASMAVLYYLIVAFFFSTGEQQRLQDENRMYEMEYPELKKKEQLVADVIEGLRMGLTPSLTRISSGIRKGSLTRPRHLRMWWRRISPP